LPRFNSPTAVNHFTSACSAMVYRDNLFGPEFANNTFVSEPVHNLIHREIMKPNGVTFTSQRAADEQTSEFLASSDNWFRPTMLQTGPDGALWVADMYRYVIEHPEWIPKDWQQKLDLRAGHDLGRIYRIYPADKTPRPIPRLDKMSVKELVACLESPNGWTRDLAQRELSTLTEPKAINEAGFELNQLLRRSKSPLARLHALPALGRLPATFVLQPASKELFGELLKDANPGVRRHVLRSIDPRWAHLVFGVERLEALLHDDDPQVRLQFAYTVGEGFDGASMQLAQMLRQEKDRYILAAAMSSLSKGNWELVFDQFRRTRDATPALLASLLPVARAYGHVEELTRLIVDRIGAGTGQPDLKQVQFLADLLDVLERNRSEAVQVAALDGIKKLHALACQTLANPKANMAERVQSARLLARGLGDDKKDLKQLTSFLVPQTPDELQAAAIRSLGRGNDPRVPGSLLDAWKSLTPALRTQVLDVLLVNPMWTRMLVEALENKQFPASEVDAARRQRLLNHRDQSIRTAAVKLFAAASDPDRNAIVNDYWLKLPEKADTSRGAKLFLKACAACHKLGNVGQAVGPDLASVGDKSPQGLLTAMLDPNRAVEARYVNYLATTRSGLTVTGMMQSETSTTITLVSSDGKAHQLLRNELEELISTGKSLMPEGLERDLSPQDMADIIAHVRAGIPGQR
jgi:putative heme-binding domain-containing protein